jgi:hypothetical protein
MAVLFIIQGPAAINPDLLHFPRNMLAICAYAGRGAGMDEADKLRAEALRLLRTIEPDSVSSHSMAVRSRAAELIARWNRLKRFSEVTTDQPTYGVVLRPDFWNRSRSDS